MVIQSKINELEEQLANLKSSKEYLDEMFNVEEEIQQILLDQWTLGKRPKYLIVSAPVYQILDERICRITTIPKGILKYATYYGYLDIIKLDRNDKFILVG